MRTRTPLPNPFPGFVPKNQITPKKKKTTNKKMRITKAGFDGMLFAFVIDESGSMGSVTNDTIGGFNSFVESQRQEDGDADIMVNKFEGGRITNLWGIKDLDDSPALDSKLYRPAGSTNLNDAIMQTLEEVNDHIKGFKKKDRPAVTIVIMTDGYENASRKYRDTNEVKAAIETCEGKDWAFTFIGADVDAFAAGSTYGMTYANTMQYDKGSTAEAFTVMSESMSTMRSAKLKGTSTEAVYAQGLYTDDQRTRAVGEDD